MGRRISRVRSSRLRVVVWISLALATLASACGSSGNRVNGPSFPVGDAGEPGGTLSADGGSDSGGGTVTDAGDAGDDAGDRSRAVPARRDVGHERRALPRARRRRDRRRRSTSTRAATGADEVARVPMTRGAPNDPWGADVTHAALAAARGHAAPSTTATARGGPTGPSTRRGRRGRAPGFVADVDALGNRFDPNKLLIDPYTHEMSHDPLEPGAALVGAVRRPGASDRATDDGQVAPKSIVWRRGHDAHGHSPTGALKDDVIYEVHVRGLTMNDPTVPAAMQGTYAGAATKARTLAALGVTADRAPAHPRDAERPERRRRRRARTTGATRRSPSSRPTAATRPTRRRAGRRASSRRWSPRSTRSGIKVFLDVVYNHTAEGGVVELERRRRARFSRSAASTTPAYYELAADHADARRRHGHRRQLQHRQRRRARSGHRLAHATGRTRWASTASASISPPCSATRARASATRSRPAIRTGILARAVAALPAGTPLIAEPWGVGTGTYQLGNFPAGWSEWNGDFRDSIRDRAERARRRRPIAPSTLGREDRRVARPRSTTAGARRRRRSTSSTATTASRCTTSTRTTRPDDDQPYPARPVDRREHDGLPVGPGRQPPPRRAQAARTGLALVALSAGVPMFQGGDEMLRTQYGNNNAYNLDDSRDVARLVARDDERVVRRRGPTGAPRVPRARTPRSARRRSGTARTTTATACPTSRSSTTPAPSPARPTWRTRRTTSSRGASTARKAATRPLAPVRLERLDRGHLDAGARARDRHDLVGVGRQRERVRSRSRLETSFAGSVVPTRPRDGDRCSSSGSGHPPPRSYVAIASTRRHLGSGKR